MELLLKTYKYRMTLFVEGENQALDENGMKKDMRWVMIVIDIRPLETQVPTNLGA